MGFTRVYQGSRTPRPFHSLPNPGGRGAGHDPLPPKRTRRGLRVLRTLRSSRSSASDTVLARDPQSHTFAPPRSTAHGDSPPDTPSAPPPAATHTHTPAQTRPRALSRSRWPAAPQGAGDDRSHLAPRVLPPAGPRRVGPPSARAGAEAAHPFIPAGREHPGHSQSRRQGGPARAMLGVVVPGLGAGGTPRGRGRRGAAQGARTVTHTRPLLRASSVPGIHSHMHTWTRTHPRTAVYTHIHTYTHSLPRRLTHTSLPHLHRLTYIYTHTNTSMP